MLQRLNPSTPKELSQSEAFHLRLLQTLLNDWPGSLPVGFLLCCWWLWTTLLQILLLSFLSSGFASGISPSLTSLRLRIKSSQFITTSELGWNCVLSPPLEHTTLMLNSNPAALGQCPPGSVIRAFSGLKRQANGGTGASPRFAGQMSKSSHAGTAMVFRCLQKLEVHWSCDDKHLFKYVE